MIHDLTETCRLLRERMRRADWICRCGCTNSLSAVRCSNCGGWRDECDATPSILAGLERDLEVRS